MIPKKTVHLLLGAALACGILVSWPSPARASFKVCNGFHETASFAVAYNEAKAGHWLASGWWTIAPGKCKTAVGGDLQDRYYYLYAYSASRQWKGNTPVCVVPNKSFDLTFKKTDHTCAFARRGFYLVDTGKATSFTATLR
jgi:uncharacterized membrane protein